jgi:AraC-like DNA-binding protein
MKLVVPNGLIKLVIPFRNGLSGKMEGWAHTSREHSITLIGAADIPSVVDTYYHSGQSSGTIGVEFHPAGANRFFRLNYRDIRNRIHPLNEVIGAASKELEEQLSNTENIVQKVSLLQHYLIGCFLRTREDTVYQYCIGRIQMTNGTVSIRQLEKETGYSSCWLGMKFQEKLGISPKNLVSIVRFQQYYQAMASGKETDFLQHRFYDFYHDQSHFIKDFKRFTGLPPKQLEHSKNDFGRIFYRE